MAGPDTHKSPLVSPSQQEAETEQEAIQPCRDELQSLTADIVPSLSPELQDVISYITKISNEDLAEEATMEKSTGGASVQSILKSAEDGDIKGVLNGVLDFFTTSKNPRSPLKNYMKFSNSPTAIASEEEIKRLQKKVLKTTNFYEKGHLTSFISHQLDLKAQEANAEKELSQRDLLQYHAKQGLYGVGDIISFDSTPKTDVGKMKKTLMKKVTSYTHCAILTSIDPLTMVQASPSNGVESISLDEYFDQKESNQVLITKGGGATVANMANEQVGKSYDYAGLAADLKEGTRVSDDSQYYCSEIVADALELDNSIITPDQILEQASPLYIAQVA